VQGVVRSTRECKPLAGAKLEWWAADGKGDYDDAHRATQTSDAEGRFRYLQPE
jgi:protocatechuate 3,4-dioxygenase beta subunit